MSFNIFLKMFIWYMTTWMVLYIFSYVIWCNYLEYNPPLPGQNLITQVTWILFMMELWIILPSELISKEEFRRKILFYYVHFFWWSFVVPALNIFLEYLFVNLPSDLQFLVALFVATFREVDKQVRSKIVKKMMGKPDEPARALISITISAQYGFFIATRLAGATYVTIFCFLLIGFTVHAYITFKLIKDHNKVKNKVAINEREHETSPTKLILAELMEGFTPMIYGITMALAYYGPNAKLFINIGSSFLGKPIHDIDHVFLTMFILFAFDALSVTINSIWLKKKLNLNMLLEFHRVIRRYWTFMLIQLSYLLTGYFHCSDVNSGFDPSGNYEWITNEGRVNMMNKSIELKQHGGRSDSDRSSQWGPGFEDLPPAHKQMLRDLRSDSNREEFAKRQEDEKRKYQKYIKLMN